MLGIGLQEIILLLLLVVVYLLASVTLVPYVASAKGRSGLAWMLIALLMSRWTSSQSGNRRSRPRRRNAIRLRLAHDHGANLRGIADEQRVPEALQAAIDRSAWEACAIDHR